MMKTNRKVESQDALLNVSVLSSYEELVIVIIK
jgi:hypothetical protein